MYTEYVDNGMAKNVFFSKSTVCRVYFQKIASERVGTGVHCDENAACL